MSFMQDHIIVLGIVRPRTKYVFRERSTLLDLPVQQKLILLCQENIKGGWISLYLENPSPFLGVNIYKVSLALTNPEHFRATAWTYTLSGWFAILHGDGFLILHFFFGTTLHTICFHVVTSFVCHETKSSLLKSQASIDMEKACGASHRPFHCAI